MERHQELQDYRQYVATKHERRVAETARQRKEDAERAELEGKQTVFFTVSNLAMIFSDLSQRIKASLPSAHCLGTRLSGCEGLDVAHWHAPLHAAWQYLDSAQLGVAPLRGAQLALSPHHRQQAAQRRHVVTSVAPEPGGGRCCGVQEERAAKAERGKKLVAVALIARVWARRRMRKRMITDVKVLVKLQRITRPWVKRAKAAVKVSGPLASIDARKQRRPNAPGIMHYWSNKASPK